MSLKFVYALISNEQDFYAEQAALSMHSLRLHNPDSHITLVTDEETLDALTGNRSLIRQYVNEFVIVNPPADFSPKQKSRFLKTSLRQNIKGDFLFLDCDTIVTDRLDALEDVQCDVAAVYAQHTNSRDIYYFDKHWNSNNEHRHMTQYYEVRDVPADEKYEIRFHCNSGVMLCRDTENAYRLFETWHQFWLESSTVYGYHSDQCDLWRADAALNGIMTELDGSYNCQIIYPFMVVRYIFDCKVFHYFSTSRRYNWISFKNPSVLKKVRKDGISSDLEKRMRTLVEEYFRDYIAYRSPLVELAKEVSTRYPSINKLVKKINKLRKKSK